MSEIFSDLPEAIENTVVISQRCGFMVNVHEKPLLPRFGDDLEAECKMLRDNTMSGLKRRLEQHGITDTAPYYEQAEFELGVIIGMGFPGYFLIVADYIDWCRNNDVLTGPGRGSAPCPAWRRVAPSPRALGCSGTGRSTAPRTAPW